MTRSGPNTSLNRCVLVGGVAFALLAPLPAAADSSNHEPNDKLPVYLDSALDLTAEDTCSPGELWQGAGNSSVTFQRKRNLDAGVELALKAIYREGPNIRSTYVDEDGLVHIEVPAGSQTIPPPRLDRAAWNFTYSYNVALDPSNPDLNQYDGHLWIDFDPSKKTKYLKLKLSTGGPSSPTSVCPGPPTADLNGYQWKSGTTVVIGDDEGTQKVTQNSQNYAFYAAAIDTDRHIDGIQPYTFGPAQFDVVLQLSKKGWHKGGHNKTTILHVVFDVVTTVPSTPAP